MINNNNNKTNSMNNPFVSSIVHVMYTMSNENQLSLFLVSSQKITKNNNNINQIYYGKCNNPLRYDKLCHP